MGFTDGLKFSYLASCWAWDVVAGTGLLQVGFGAWVFGLFLKLPPVTYRPRDRKTPSSRIAPLHPLAEARTPSPNPEGLSRKQMGSSLN